MDAKAKLIKKDQIQEIGPSRFEVSGNLIRKLGRESISNKNVAILELIKNSYDAHATKVEINFNDIDTQDGSITILDDGQGMDFSDLENKWMRIATPWKTKLSNQKNRITIGEKGIGRLSVESLGRKTILHSFPSGENAGYKIIFDWEKYQQENVLVNEITNPTYKFKKKKSEHGTRLDIHNLNHDWNDEGAQRELLTDINLLNPINKPITDFRVIPRFSSSLVSVPKVKRDFLNRAVYKLKTRLVGGLLVRYEFVPIKGKKKEGHFNLDRKLKCGDTVFELYFFYKSPKYLKDALGVEIDKTAAKEIVSFLEYYSGVKLYRDNFRVKPYGEPKSDWLGLDIAAHNNSMYPRNDAIIGMVYISKSKNSKIIDTTTREGVLYSDEFQDLLSFVRTSIFRIFADLRSELEYHKIKARKRKSKKPKLKVVPATRSEMKELDEKFLDIKNYPENFYYRLQDEIDLCYNHNHPNAVFFLCRKLIENLVFNILEKKFPNDINLWFDNRVGIKMRHKFGVLVKNLYDKRNNFKPNAKSYIEKFNGDVGLFKKEANLKAHYIFEYLRDKKELDKFKIDDLVQLLINIYNSI
jgi:hypothetical protein